MFIEFLELPYTQLLLKNTYVWVRSAFYADYIVSDSFSQDLHKKANVIHKNIMIGEDGNFNRYDDLDFGDGNLSNDGNYIGGGNENEGDAIEGRSEISRSYLPKTTPSIDRLSEKLVPGFMRVEPPYNGLLDIDEGKRQIIEQVMTKVIAAAGLENTKIGSLEAESTSRAFEKNENIPKEIIYPFGYFDNKVDLTPEEYAQYKRNISDYFSVAGGGYTPAIVPSSGNDIVAGRIFSITVDELWEYIKRLVDGRPIDPLRPDYQNRGPEGIYNSIATQSKTFTRDEEPTLFSQNAQLNDQDTRLPIVQNFSFLYDKKLNYYATKEVDNPNYLKLRDEQAIRYKDFNGEEYWISGTITEQQINQLDPYFNYSLPLEGNIYQETQYISTIDENGLEKYEYIETDGYYKPSGWVSWDNYISGILTDPFPSGTKWYNDYVLSKPIRQVKINDFYQRLTPDRKLNNVNYRDGKDISGNIVEWPSGYSLQKFPDDFSESLSGVIEYISGKLVCMPGFDYVGAQALPSKSIDDNFFINYNSFIVSTESELNIIYQKPFYPEEQYRPSGWIPPANWSEDNPFNYNSENKTYEAETPLNITNPHYGFIEHNFENVFNIKNTTLINGKRIKNKLWEFKQKDILRGNFSSDKDFGEALNIQWELMGGTYYGELAGKKAGEIIINPPYGKTYTLKENHLSGKIYIYKPPIVLNGEPNEYTVEIVDTARRLYDKKFLFEYYFDGVWLKKERVYDLYPSMYEKYDGSWYPLNKNWNKDPDNLFIDNIEDIGNTEQQEPKYLKFPKREEWQGSENDYAALYQKYFERQVFIPIEQAYYPYYEGDAEYNNDKLAPPLVNNRWRFNTEIAGIVLVKPASKYVPVYILSDKHTKNLKYIPHKIYILEQDTTPQKVAIGDPLDYKYKQVVHNNITDVSLIATRYVSMPTYFSYSIFDGLKEMSRQLSQYAQSKQYDIYDDNGIIIGNYRDVVNYLPWKQQRDNNGNPIKLNNITNDKDQILAQGEPNGVDSIWGPRKNPLSLRELEAYINQTKYNLITLSRYIQNNFTVAGFSTQGVYKSPEISASFDYAGAATDYLEDIEMRQLAQVAGGGLYQLHKDYNLNPLNPNTIFVKDGFDSNAVKNTSDMNEFTHHYGAPAIFNDLSSPFDYAQNINIDAESQENIRKFQEITRQEYGLDPLLPGSSLDYEADDVYLSATGVWKYKFDKIRIPVLETDY
jgi:hypothetical protein